MNKALRYILLPLALLATVAAGAQASCPTRTNEGNDFWLTFIKNGSATSSIRYQRIFVTTSDSAATVSIHNPGTGWSSTFSLGAYARQMVELPLVTPLSGSPTNDGYHLSATAKVAVWADHFVPDSWDIAMVLPTHALRTRYVVQDISLATDYPGGVAFVATEDSTVLTMTLPCTVDNVSIPVGGVYTSPALMAGQSLYLGNAAGHGFDGMVINSNGKPFATFQGHSCARVGSGASNYGRDHMFEQALPTDLWGTDFIVTPSATRLEGDVVKVTASANGCTVSADGIVQGTLDEGENMELTLPTGTCMHIETSQPAYVCLYTYSYHHGGTAGDACSITIPPSDRWVCHATFFIGRDNTDITSEHYIPANGHHLNIVVRTEDIPFITLNGSSAGLVFSPATTGYSYASVVIQPDSTYTIDGQGHRFEAHAYAFSLWVAAGFAVGMELNDYERQLDTVHIYDTVCPDVRYDTLCIHLDSVARQPRTQSHDCRSGDTLFVLHLTVLDAPRTDVYDSIVAGDTLAFADTILTTAGTYTFTYASNSGCDSTVVMHLGYRNVRITMADNGICPGDTTTLTADGVREYIWAAQPDDPLLASQQGQPTVRVAPQTTTVYSLLDAQGNILCSATIHIAPPPTLCIETNRDILDFDHPVLLFTDCSAGSTSTTWHFDDGVVLHGQKARRTFAHPLPDSVGVTMTACNNTGCCVDTTIHLPMRVRSVWFPNIITPMSDDGNNRFGCWTTYDVESYTLTVFNRWGFEVYSTDDIGDRWDGTDSGGNRLPQGAYVFLYHVRDKDGTVENGTGTVTIIY